MNTIKKTILAVSLSALMSPFTYAEDFDLDDLIPAKPGQQVELKGEVKSEGDIVVAEHETDAVAIAHQQLLEEEDDGIKLITVSSGVGIVAVGTATYNTYDNHNATLLSKRGAYIEAAQKAKRQLVENMEGMSNSCETATKMFMDVIDTGTDSVANTSKTMNDGCGEAVAGSLAGYVTFDVFDDVEETEVRVSLISTPKTRNQTRQRSGALMVTTDPNAIFKHVVSDLKKGLLPPVGAKVLTNPDTGETYVMGFGSSVIRTNKNKSVAKKLKQTAKKQSSARARNALIAVMQGEKVYWQGSFDESQVESSEQFKYDPETLDPREVEVLDQERDQFVNHMKDSDEYRTMAAGKVPPGVKTKTFKSGDGHWMLSVAIYSPSLEATSREAAKQMKGAGANQKAASGRKINAYGGKNEQAANSQAMSGQVSDASNL